ncbi:hypothetical protein NDNC_0760 [Candidatus Nasuia deltocephalinicola]|nr:hypothetical protein NDNC_0760 [Candidatus Nasuia deltocephalinicola]
MIKKFKWIKIKELNQSINDQTSFISQFQKFPQEIFAQKDPIIFPILKFIKEKKNI